ncbi:1612_t:CDS:2, partial [Funneliformis geosporum]
EKNLYQLATNMILSQLKTHISSRASYLFLADYKDIMQYRDMKRQEFNRIQWNDLAVTPSIKVIDKQNEERQAERDF